MYKRFGECKDRFEIINRLEALRNNMVNYSNGEFRSSNSNAIYVNWNWINYFEVRLDTENNVNIEIWVADVKHQWNGLSKVSSMNFVSKQKPEYNIKGLNTNAKHHIGAYIKLGDTYGKTLKVADFELAYVQDKFDKEYYKNFYNTLGGRWEKNVIKDDFTKSSKLLMEEIEKLNLVEYDKKLIIDYIKEETRNVVNLSLGTTVNLFIPINDLIIHDDSKEDDKIAKALYECIMEYKEVIEDERK